MNEVTKQKTGRRCVEAFKQAARQLTDPVGRFEAMYNAERLLAIIIFELPLVDFDPLAAEVEGVNGETTDFSRSPSCGNGVVKDPAVRTDSAKYHLDRSSGGTHPATSRMKSTPGTMSSSGAPYSAKIDTARRKANGSANGDNSTNVKALQDRNMSAGPANGSSGDRSMEQQAIGQPGSQVIPGGGESDSDPAPQCHAPSGNPCRPMIRQLNNLSDAILGRSRPPNVSRPYDDHPSPPMHTDSNGRGAHFADPPIRRTSRDLHVRPDNTVSTKDRGEHLSTHSMEKTQALLNSQKRTHRPDKNRTNVDGGSNEYRLLVMDQKRRITKTINVLYALTSNHVDGDKGVISSVHRHQQQKNGSTIQPSVLSDGRNSNRAANLPENPQSQHGVIRTIDESLMNGRPSHDDQMAAEQLTDMINDVLVSQARRHGVDI